MDHVSVEDRLRPSMTVGGDDDADDHQCVLTHRRSATRRSSSQSPSTSSSSNNIAETASSIGRDGADAHPMPSPPSVNDLFMVVDTILGRGVAEKTADGLRNVIYKSTDASRRVYQAIASNDRVVQFRIGVDGKLIFDKTLRRFDSHRKRAAHSVRKAITGDPNKTIRDHLRETPQVKMLDKVSFTMGVAVIAFTEYIILRLPSYFIPYYVALMLSLFAIRLHLYKQSKYHLFMLDFCYLVNVLCMLQTTLWPDNRTWFLANYTLVMGPICLGTVLWNNSLVFHSIDKLTSFFIHIFPPILYHLWRWGLIRSERHDALGDLDNVSIADMFVPSMGIYVAWQICYLISTEILLRTELASDPELMTSLRYMVRDKRNVVAVAVTKHLKRAGFIKDDQADPESVLAKCVLITIQLVYTVGLIGPTVVLFHSFYLSSAYLVAICLFATWNGASYYIEIFSKRYNLQFEDAMSDKLHTCSTGTAVSGDSECATTSERISGSSGDKRCHFNHQASEYGECHSSSSASMSSSSSCDDDGSSGTSATAMTSVSTSKLTAATRTSTAEKRRNSISEGHSTVASANNSRTASRLSNRSRDGRISSLDDAQAYDLLQYFSALNDDVSVAGD